MEKSQSQNIGAWYLYGFARIRCPDCAEEVLEEVGHAQWVFVMAKMLRPYFLHHRELLGGLAHAAWETVLELMCVAVGALHRDVPGTPREARQTLVVPAWMEAAGASSAWSQALRLPNQRPR